MDCAEKLYKSPFFFTKLDATVRGPVENPPALPDPQAPTIAPVAIPRRSRIYVQMPNNQVFSGILQDLRHRSIPFWVIQPTASTGSIYRVYIRMPNGSGLLSIINPLPLAIHINDDIDEEHTPFNLFIPMRIRTFLSAHLHRYNHHRLPMSSFPYVFVRMPYSNNVYAGQIDYDFGQRPIWLH